MTLTRGQFLVRFASIMAEYMEVMDAGETLDQNHLAVDGARLLRVIGNLTGLVSDMHHQMTWQREAGGGIYN